MTVNHSKQHFQQHNHTVIQNLTRA